MTHVNKHKLQEAIREVRAVYHDAIAARIQHTDKSYAAIANELGCSEQTVFLVAKIRCLGRNSQQSSSQPDVADEGRDAGDGGSHE